MDFMILSILLQGLNLFFDIKEPVLENGKLDLFNAALQRHCDERTELERTNALIKELYTWSINSNKKITIAGYSRDTSRLCQFTGGGDILIHGSQDVALISTGSLVETGDIDENINYDNEMSICATVENKVREQHDVRLQLQANMVLAVVSVFKKRSCPMRYPWLTFYR